MPARRLAAQGVAPDNLAQLPAGSVVLVLAATGYGKSRLADEWLKETGEGCVLLDATDLPSDPQVAARTAAGFAPTDTASQVVIVDRVERFDDAAGAAFLETLRAELPRAIVAMLGRRVPHPPDLPEECVGLLVRQSHLAIERGQFEGVTHGSELGRDWPLEVEQILIDDWHGWPAAVPLVARQLSRQQEVGLDPSLLRHILTLEAGAAIESDLQTMDENRLRTLTEIALVAPATTDQLTRCFGDRTLEGLKDLIRSPVQMLSHRAGVWHVAPVFRDILLAHHPEQWERRLPLNLDLADEDARGGRLDEGLERVRRLNSRSALARFVGRWALHESVRGFPGVGADLMREFDREEIRRVPDLILVQAVINVLTPDLPTTSYWLDLLQEHHDVEAPRWSSTDPATTSLLREVVGSRAVGPVSRAALTSAPGWAAGLAHVIIATRQIGRGDYEHAEGILSGARAYSQEFPLIGGWRVALLVHVLIETGRVPRALELYRRVEPSLASSDFRRQRITFLIDSAMARCAALAGDLGKADELMARSLDKTPEFRAGAWTTRVLAYYNNAFAAHTLGKSVVAASAIEAALALRAKTPEATALSALVEQLQQQLGAQRQGPRLTPMQLRVLAYLDTPYSVPEIANLLVLSPATIRSHVRQVYAALGATHRTDAIERAKAVGVLD